MSKIVEMLTEAQPDARRVVAAIEAGAKATMARQTGESRPAAPKPPGLSK